MAKNPSVREKFVDVTLAPTNEHRLEEEARRKAAYEASAETCEILEVLMLPGFIGSDMSGKERVLRAMLRRLDTLNSVQMDVLGMGDHLCRSSSDLQAELDGR